MHVPQINAFFLLNSVHFYGLTYSILIKNIEMSAVGQLLKFSLSTFPKFYCNVAATTIKNVDINYQNGDLDKLYHTIELELKGNDPAVLSSFAKFATTAGSHLDVESVSWNLRKPVHERYTVLKSVHIYKKHRVQYEHRTYFMFVQYKSLTGSTADTLLEYVQRNLPEGVALKTTMVQLEKLKPHLISSK